MPNYNDDDDMEAPPSPVNKNKTRCAGCGETVSKAKLSWGYCRECHRDEWFSRYEEPQQMEEEWLSDKNHRLEKALEKARQKAEREARFAEAALDRYWQAVHSVEAEADLKAQLESAQLKLRQEKADLTTTQTMLRSELKRVGKEREELMMLKQESEELVQKLQQESEERDRRWEAERADLKRREEEARKAAHSGRTDHCQWKWEKDPPGSGDWEDMAAPTCLELDACYSEYLNCGVGCSVKIGHYAYLIDFQSMKQENASNKKVRRIRYVVPAPNHWKRYLTIQNRFETACDCVLQELPDEVGRHVFSGLQQTWCQGCPKLFSGGKIKLWQVENLPLWNKYQAARENMRRDFSKLGMTVSPLTPCVPPNIHHEIAANVQNLLELDRSVNEVLAFHGTSHAGMEEIIKNGLDPRFAKRLEDPSDPRWQMSVGYYGDGTYFATKLCKSMQYTPDKANSYIIVARVLLGEPYYTKKVCRGMKVPPPNDRCTKAKAEGRFFDSVVANVGPMEGHQGGHQAHQELVIFDKAHAYPEFVLRISK